jgi:DNA-binding SARP family transcriptional activator
MRFVLLGPVGVSGGHAPAKLDGPRVKALLAYLLLHANHPVSTTELLDALWGEDVPRSGATAVQNTIARLRRSVGERVVTVGSGYLVRVEPGELDLLEFRELVAGATGAAPRERAETLREALALWIGAPLGGVESAAYAGRETAALEDERLAAVSGRIDAELELGQHAELVPLLSNLAAEHPLDERFRRQLIVALYRSGRQAAALDVYRETRRLLMDELGLEPSASLRALERSVLTQDPALDPPQTGAEAVPAPAVGQVAVVNAQRRPGRVGVGVLTALAVGTAGAALAVALTRSDGPTLAEGATTIVSVSTIHSTAPAATRPRLHTVPRRRATTTTQPRRPRKHPVAVPLVTHAVISTRDRTTTAVTTNVVTPRTTTPRPRTQPQTTTRAKTTPRPTTTAPAVGRVYVIADNFTEPGIDLAVWHLASHGSGVTVSEQNGRLEFAIDNAPTFDGQFGTDQHYGTQCELEGDFDATVDFQLLDWPAGNGVNLSFGLYVPPPNESWLFIERRGASAAGGVEGYGATGGGWADTSDASGSLRLRRRGAFVTMYYRYRSSWTSIGSIRQPNPGNLVLSLNTNTPQFGFRPATAAMDNFTMTADGVACHGAPLPPTKPRV